MRNLILIIMYLLFTISCVSQKKEIISKSTIKLEGKNTNIRDLIEIDGYYTLLDYPQYGSIMFFENGIWVYFHFQRGISEDEKKSNMSKNVTAWVENSRIRWGTYWGVYRIQNDTIIVHSYDEGSFWKGWSLDESRYKVIDRISIEGIYGRSILKSADDYYKTHSPWRKGTPQCFSSADSLPSSDCWLKEEKWIWRNESDWKAYMEKIKKNKKK